MASNALSKRRGPLRRPKPCVTPKNPGRCEPDPEPPRYSCGLKHDDFPNPIYTGEEEHFSWRGCNTGGPKSEILTPICIAKLGEITDIESAENCTEGNTIEYTAPDDPGDETIWFIIIWDDHGSCSVVLNFRVDDEPNGD